MDAASFPPISSSSLRKDLSGLIESLETLYHTVLNLTRKADEKALELDKQIAIEGTRSAILEEADHLLQEISAILSSETEVASIDVARLDQKRDQIVALIAEIRVIDQKRIAWFFEEKMALQQILSQFHLGQQAVSKYKQAVLDQD